MAHKIIGNLEVTSGLTVNNKNALQSVNSTIKSNINGNLIIDGNIKDEVLDMFSQFPVSNVGDLGFLPLGVSGSYEGATNNYEQYMYPMQLEDDGTLTFLRPGTNGSSQGFYYAYINNALTTQDMTPITTTIKYHPSFVPQDRYIKSFATSDNSIFMGRLDNNQTFFSFPNGTMDQSKHTGFITSTIEVPDYVFMGKTYVYFLLGLNSADGDLNDTSPFSFKLSRVLISDLRAGNVNSYTTLTNWTSTGIYGTTSTNTNIVMAKKLADPNLANEPFCQYIGNFRRVLIFHQYRRGSFWGVEDESTGKIRVFCQNFIFSEVTFTSKSERWAFNFVIDVANKTAIADSDSRGYVTVTSPDQQTVVYNNPNLSFSMANITGTNETYRGAYNQLTLPSGIIFATDSTHFINQTFSIGRGQISNFTTVYNSFMRSTRTIVNRLSLFVQPTYGSAIGQNMVGVQPFPNNSLVVNARGENNGVSSSGYVFSKYGSAGYIYPSISSGTISGFAPRPERKFVGNNLRQLISIVDAAKNVSVYGSSFWEDGRISNALNFSDTNLVGTGTQSIELSTLIGLKTQILTSAYGSIWNNTISSSKIILYSIPNTINYSYAVVMFKMTNLEFRFILAEVSLSISNNVITAASLGRITNNTILDTDTNVEVTTNNQQAQGGLIIYEAEDFYYINIGIPFSCGVVGTSLEYVVQCAVDKTSKKIMEARTRATRTYAVLDINLRPYGVIPSLGFGFYKYSLSDYQTKLVFVPVGNNLNAYDLWNLNGVNNVILSQDVYTGFIVYFTQNTPVFISGKYKLLPIQSILLNDIKSNPANTTFYLYVNMLNGNAQYQISTTELAESYECIYLGTIVTDGTKIATINVSKVSRIDTYRPSRTQIGSAFPVSDNSATTNW
ncbi:Phage minor tail protein [Yersinia phage fHe-Yen9-04]|uniref:Phage minor tail protein n=1 Tax=Yersinia phage fHe-Yen9-04 TaxID=2052742 RepID=A0A2C9CX91_9CAUD|nr:Phage minor tail protein [Yersinia phage fHe-Yen9-04]SOK58415.1 Phage minor tail protein [Yersinia phage fHe-Yen9-04]VUE36184.1 Phage minor tail protein [Yersinia phage fHe-Yen9-04]